jgi:hypothetical protein
MYLDVVLALAYIGLVKRFGVKIAFESGNESVYVVPVLLEIVPTRAPYAELASESLLLYIFLPITVVSVEIGILLS